MNCDPENLSRSAPIFSFSQLIIWRTRERRRPSTRKNLIFILSQHFFLPKPGKWTRPHFLLSVQLADPLWRRRRASWTRCWPRTGPTTWRSSSGPRPDIASAPSGASTPWPSPCPVRVYDDIDTVSSRKFAMIISIATSVASCLCVLTGLRNSIHRN